MDVADDHYFVLGAPRRASKEELKKCYHHLLLEHHPDKLQTNGNSTQFCKIDKAWKILSDDKLRQQYDARLKALETECSQPMHEEIKISDMELDEEFGLYTKHCRCGGRYAINKEDILTNDLIIECDNCSLNILVQVS